MLNEIDRHRLIALISSFMGPDINSAQWSKAIDITADAPVVRGTAFSQASIKRCSAAIIIVPHNDEHAVFRADDFRSELSVSSLLVAITHCHASTVLRKPVLRRIRVIDTGRF